MRDVSEEQRRVGQRLRDLRRAAGQSQGEAAAGAHISRQYLSEAEAGANISLAVVIRLAQHFGVKTTSIVEVVDTELHDAIREATAERTANADPEAYAQIDKQKVQPLIGESLDQGWTRPSPPEAG